MAGRLLDWTVGREEVPGSGMGWTLRGRGKDLIGQPGSNMQVCSAQPGLTEWYPHHKQAHDLHAYDYLT